jgi:hypothetical protein
MKARPVKRSAGENTKFLYLTEPPLTPHISASNADFQNS